MNSLKKLVSCLLTGVFCLLAGCSDENVESFTFLDYPETEESAPPRDAGQSTVFASQSCTICYASSQDDRIYTQEQSVSRDSASSAAESAIRHLLNAYTVYPTGTSLLSIRETYGNAIVLLSADALAFGSDRDRFRLVASIADTLLSDASFSTVTVVAGGRVISPAGGAISQSAFSYADYESLVPVPLRVTAKDGFLYAEQAGGSTLPASSGPTVDSTGRRFLSLDLPEETPDDEAAAAVMTLLLATPDTDAVCLTRGAVPVTGLTLRDITLSRGDACYTLSDLLIFFGETADVFVPNENNLSLSAISVPVGTRTSPVLLARALLDSYDDGDFAITFSCGKNAILGAELRGGTLSLNLSDPFYAAAQSFTREEEKLVIYSIVNTLTRTGCVSCVRFYINGGQADTLSGYINLRASLIANPGLIK